MIWISGPIVEEIGLNNDIGYLSPGYRANSTIGRAIAMCMINIGWRANTGFYDGRRFDQPQGGQCARF
ncbi:MAG: hypothetical protein JXR49_02895 [Acidobacteria bacterium]|nr:hypothetical protein [Acidobacteriota bacterium]